jgi:hypothetical protein
MKIRPLAAQSRGLPWDRQILWGNRPSCLPIKVRRPDFRSLKIVVNCRTLDSVTGSGIVPYCGKTGHQGVALKIVTGWQSK